MNNNSNGNGKANEVALRLSDVEPATARPTSHRAASIQLPADPREAAAQALAYVRGDDSFDRSAALEAMNSRVSLLGEADSDAALMEMAAQLPIMEALWLRFAAQSVSAASPDHQAKFLRMALNAQAAYSRTGALIAGLRQQRKGSGRVVLHDGNDEDRDHES